MTIFDYVIIGQNPLPLVIKRNHLETPSPLLDYVICERPLKRNWETRCKNFLIDSISIQIKEVTGRQALSYLISIFILFIYVHYNPEN